MKNKILPFIELRDSEINKLIELTQHYSEFNISFYKNIIESLLASQINQSEFECLFTDFRSEKKLK